MKGAAGIAIDLGAAISTRIPPLSESPGKRADGVPGRRAAVDRGPGTRRAGDVLGAVLAGAMSTEREHFRVS